MRRVVAIESLTLDGVMQAPGRPDEDVRDGCEHGGWAIRPPALRDDGHSVALRLVDSVTTTTGVTIATHQPAEHV